MDDCNKTADVVSVVIRVRNAVDDLRKNLAALYRQELPENTNLDLVVVDNESNDDAVNVALEYGANVVSIMSSEFSWGRALNRGIAKTRGDLVLILSVDAYPVETAWLCEMIKPFKDPSVAAVYGRQEPRSNAPIDERARIARTFGSQSCVLKRNTTNLEVSNNVNFVSNTCAAIRRRCWEELAYDEDKRGAEERVWTLTMVARGYSVCYQASACVYHSHRDTIRRFVWREWELFYQRSLDRDGCEPTIRKSIWTAGALIKRRVKNCLQVSGFRLRKVEGLARLPLEVFLFLTVDLLGRSERLRRQLRPLFWG